MYIPEFWCGVSATLLVEIAIIFISAVICAFASSKSNKGKTDEEDKQ